ncbi:MAG: methylthioribose-phosphate isomerase, partial [Actinomycetota bacterium]|nr:methylthioribose-phosphate isomerase [Actinomycetota bacterium]
IVVEERDPDEVTHAGTRRIAPVGAGAFNPAFDITPARLVTAIVTECGAARPPYRRSLPAHVRRAAEVVTPGP